MGNIVFALVNTQQLIEGLTSHNTYSYYNIYIAQLYTQPPENQHPIRRETDFLLRLYCTPIRMSIAYLRLGWL